MKYKFYSGLRDPIMKSEMRRRLDDIRCNDDIRSAMRDAESVIGAVGTPAIPGPVASVQDICEEDFEVDGV